MSKVTVSRRELRLIVMSAGMPWQYLTNEEQRAVISLYRKVTKGKK